MTHPWAGRRPAHPGRGSRIPGAARRFLEQACGQRVAATAVAAALGLGSVSAWSQTASDKKKELIARVLQLQVPEISRALVEQPAMSILQQALQAVRERLPADQREAAAKRIQDSTRRFVDEATPLLRERAQKLAPSTFAVSLDQKFNEEELRQLVGWLDSPVSRKYQQVMPEAQSAFAQKLIADARPMMDPKLKQLDDTIRSTLGIAAAAAAPASKPASK